MSSIRFAAHRERKSQIRPLFDTKKDRLSFEQAIMDIFNFNINVLSGLLMFRFQ